MRIQRLITIDYDDDTDCAYLALVPRDAGNEMRSMATLDLSNGEGILAKLIVYRDALNRILGLDLRGAMALMPPGILLDENDTEPPRLGRRLHSITERSAIRVFADRVQSRALASGRPVADILTEELKLL